MSKKDLKEGEVVAYILSHMDSDLECETDFSNLPSMGRTTAFSVLKGMGELVEHRGDARYRLMVPRRALQQDELLIGAMDETIRALYLIQSATEKLFPYAVHRLKDRHAICSACEHYEKCMRDEEVECPSQFKVEPVQSWTGMILSLRDQEEEKNASSELNWEKREIVSEPEMDPEKTPPTPPTGRVSDARDLIRGKLAESKKAQEERPASMKQQIKELRIAWEEGMRELYGADFHVQPWGPKEFKLAPKLISENTLELTKSGVRLYLKSWEKVRAENAWIDTDIPTFGTFWHFRDKVFAAVQGKGVIGGRAAKRTADECHDEDEDYTGGWPDDGDEASASPA